MESIPVSLEAVRKEFKKITFQKYDGRIRSISEAGKRIEVCFIDYKYGNGSKIDSQRVLKTMDQARSYLEESIRAHNAIGAYCQSDSGREENQGAIDATANFYNALVDALNLDPKLREAIGELERIEL